MKGKIVIVGLITFFFFMIIEHSLQAQKVWIPGKGWEKETQVKQKQQQSSVTQPAQQSQKRYVQIQTEPTLLDDLKRLLVEKKQRYPQWLQDTLQSFDNEKYKTCHAQLTKRLESDAHVEMQVDVLFWDAVCLHQMGDYEKSYSTLEQLFKSNPPRDLYNAALRIDFDIAQKYLSGEKRKFLGLKIIPAADEGIRIMNQIQERAFPNDEIAPDASFAIGNYYFEKRDYLQSQNEFDYFTKRYPGSKRFDEANFKKVESIYFQYQGTSHDITPLGEALNGFQIIRETTQSDSIRTKATFFINEIEEQLAKEYYSIGQFYAKSKQPKAAMLYFNIVAKNYKGTTWALKAERAMDAFPED